MIKNEEEIKIKENNDDKKEPNESSNKTKFKWKKGYISLKIKVVYLQIFFLIVFTICCCYFILFHFIKPNFTTEEKKINYLNYINIAYSVGENDSYIVHVSMKSIMLSQNPETFIKFFILTSHDISDNDIDIINNICIHNQTNCEINFIKIGDRYKEFNSINMNNYSNNTFYFLRLPELIEKEEKILCLSITTLVYKDLTKIYNYDIANKYFIGILDKDNEQNFNITNYIDTGVMLMNLNELRKNDVVSMLEDYLIKKNTRLVEPFNEVINNICHENNGYFTPGYIQYSLCDINDYYNNANNSSMQLENGTIIKDNIPHIYYIRNQVNETWKGIAFNSGRICPDSIIKFFNIAIRTKYYKTIIEEFQNIDLISK